MSTTDIVSGHPDHWLFSSKKISKGLIKNEKIICLIFFHETRYTVLYDVFVKILFQTIDF